MAASGSRAKEGLWALRTSCPSALASASRAHQSAFIRVLLSGAPRPDLAPGCFHDWGLGGHFYRR